MIEGYIRTAACVPEVHLGDPFANVKDITDLAREAAAQGAHVAVFPEMCVTGYTCADLFHNEHLLCATEKAIEALAADTYDLGLTLIVGAPLYRAGALYNCALVIADGLVRGVVPKTYIPTYNEFYERRWWASGTGQQGEICVGGQEGVPFGTDQIFDINGVNVGIEICEDLWVPVPPSCHLSLCGAEVICNLSATDQLIGKYSYLTELIRQQSARCLCGYVYAGAGWGESSTDLVFAGPTMIAECGTVLCQGRLNELQPHLIVADIDVMAIRHNRMHQGTFADCARNNVLPSEMMGTDCHDMPAVREPLLRPLTPTPFVPHDSDHLRQRCDEITNIQVLGLARRLQATHAKTAVVGISGGLDSTLALLVTARAFDLLGLSRQGIIGVTMPGFGTTGRTHDNAVALIKALGVTLREINIAKGVRQHFADIGHDEAVKDVTYENSQARYRTMLLMDIANQECGLVIGTGDLSELALGWATYNGDHMSMYGVNAGVPKTLVRYLVANYAQEGAVKALLDDIVATPVSPELLPADDKGQIAQRTEDLVGPYELHDFFLYYMLRYGFGPRRIFALAHQAFDGSYDDKTIAKWLRTFMRRFFAQQFKRSCLPDGPKVGSVCLSPRGDWRMPSDASSAIWLKVCDEILAELEV